MTWKMYFLKFECNELVRKLASIGMRKHDITSGDECIYSVR